MRNPKRALPLMMTAVVSVASATPVSSIGSQPDQPLPFSVGERLTYRVTVARFGNVGRGEMWIEGPVEVRGVSTWLLRFDFSAGKGPVRAADVTSSWLDPERMAAQRFFKREKHILAQREEHVELFPADRRWASTVGENGVSPTSEPLDELSFMYFIRTLPLKDGDRYSFNRHFDAARSPTSLTVVKRESILTGAGTFSTVLVEMRVRDPRRYKGEGVIRINLSDDGARLPVRIESRMPVIGTAVMTLETFNDPTDRTLALRPE